jgi:hypothetical protein
MRAVVVAVLVALALAGCGGEGSGTTATSGGGDAASTSSATAAAFDQELHDELVQMLETEQAERMEGDFGGDAARTERLKEIVAEHGWPTISLVGEDGEDAAWAVAQHSDQDPGFQAEALGLIREAVERGDASPGNLAYLTDRVAAGRDEPQTYGTQIGCTDDGPAPAPIEDEEGVDARRAEVGLAPLAEYLAELEEVCAQEMP